MIIWRYGFRHCVSTITTPGAGREQDLMHSQVATAESDTTLPQGEGCYDCDLPAHPGGIPLQRPRTLRNRRHAIMVRVLTIFMVVSIAEL